MWFEFATGLGNPPRSEKLNDLVFGSGRLRIEYLSPNVDEIKLLEFGSFKFMKCENQPVCNEEQILLSNPRKVYIRPKNDPDSLNKLVDAKVSSLEANLVTVRSSMESLRSEMLQKLTMIEVSLKSIEASIFEKIICAFEGVSFRGMNIDNSLKVMEGSPIGVEPSPKKVYQKERPVGDGPNNVEIHSTPL
ncbi:hypothetical protein OROMI_034533 [Orobanche minor]